MTARDRSSGRGRNPAVTRGALIAVALAAIVGLSSSPGAGGTQAAQSRPEVASSVRHDTSAPLRSMRIPRVSQRAAEKAAKAAALPRHAIPRPEPSQASRPQRRAAQTNVVTAAMPDFEQSFEGQGNVAGVLPPDTQGDVGPNHYVQWVNLTFAIYDKQGQQLFGPAPGNTLWQGFGGPCETFNAPFGGGDPITIYDEKADRWFQSQLAYPGGAQGFHACIAVSATPDPLGPYHRYDFLYSADTLNDYPKFGVWGDAYYMTANDFRGAAQFSGVGVQAYEREKMLAGDPARVVTFHIGDSSGIYASLLPADAEGQALGFAPPAGAPAPFVQFDDDAWGFSPTDRLLMWDFAVDWANPASATFGVGPGHAPNRFFETEPFDSNLCNYARSCIPQPGTNVGLDAFGDRPLHRLAYRNNAGEQSLVLNHAVDVGASDHAGIRWYELTNTGVGWSLEQQGTHAPDADHRWMGSIAQDVSGNIALGYSVSSAATFPSIRVAGRLTGDPAGELAQGERELVAGGGSQTHTASRWGDYAAMQVDPTDGCTFWFTTEYMQTTGAADWKTRIGSFRFPNCTAGPRGEVTGTVTNASNDRPIAGARVSTSAGSTITDEQGRYRLTLPAGTYNITFSAFGFNPKTVSGVEITDGGTTTLDAELEVAPTVTLSGKVRDGDAHAWPLYARIDIAGRPGGPIYTDPVTGRYSVEIPANATYSIRYATTLPGYEVVTEDVTVGGANTTHDVEIPIQASCTAPGYRFVFTEVKSESFNAGTLPPGWTVTDEVGNDQVWAFDDPRGRGNLTGGDGAFAIMDSDRFGSGNTQDSSLVSPTIDLSSVQKPVIRFNEDYVNWAQGDQNVDVDVSIDDGATWETAFRSLATRRGPRVTVVPIPQAAGEPDVKVRWRYRSTFGYWWEVDNAWFGNRSCDPIPGGLVVGNVFDLNTSQGLNGATVASAQRPAERGTTAATPDDPANPDGYYWLFSSGTGSQAFTASKSPYQSQTRTVTVAADGVTRADFSLASGRVEATPASVSRTLRLGTTTTATVTFKNTGTAPADVTLSERKGSFRILTAKGSPLLKLRLGKGQADPGWLGDHADDERAPGIDAGPPNQPTWSPIDSHPVTIMDNAADRIDGTVYSVGGFNGSAIVADGYAYDPVANGWSAIADMAVAREKPGAGAIGGRLYVSGGWSTSGNPLAQTEAYDPGGDTWETVAQNPAPRAAPGTAVVDDRLYLVGGCVDGFCAPSNTVMRYDPDSDGWEELAPYPHQTSWLSCGGIDGKVYCAGGTAGGTFHNDGFVYDPAADEWSPIANMPFNLWGSAYGAANGVLVISSGLTMNTLTNQGLAYDPSTDSWSALPNAQFPRFRGAGACGFYKIGGSSIAGFSPTRESEQLSELDQCGVTDVPWMVLSPTSFRLAPGQSRTVVVFVSATPEVDVTQPGAYTAQIGVAANTPSRVAPIDVTMDVTPPPTWGKIAGTVTGIACNGATAPLQGAQVQADGREHSFSLLTDREGKYAFWAPQGANPFQMIVSKDGWVAQVRTVRIVRQQTVTADFGLRRVRC